MARLRFIRAVCLTLTLGFVPVCLAQEVGFLDLTQIRPRENLRHPTVQTGQPPGPRGVNNENIECGPPTQMGALQTSLVSLDRSSYQPGDQPIFEVQIENVGAVAVQLPFSPNLSDLQPADAAQKFSYSSLLVQLWFGGAMWKTTGGGSFYLFGDDNHPGTMLTLHPGEWVRIIGRGKIRLPEDYKHLTRAGDVASQATANTSIYDNETLVTATASATVSHGVCLRYTQGPTLPFQIVP